MVFPLPGPHGYSSLSPTSNPASFLSPSGPPFYSFLHGSVPLPTGVQLCCRGERCWGDNSFEHFHREEIPLFVFHFLPVSQHCSSPTTRSVPGRVTVREREQKTRGNAFGSRRYRRIFRYRCRDHLHSIPVRGLWHQGSSAP